MQQSTKDHALQNMETREKDYSKLCSSCEEESALQLCTDCDKFLCQKCSDIHQRQKNTKSHELIDSEEIKTNEAHHCDLCNDENDIKSAIKYCEQCEDFLCKSCSEVHEHKEITRSHEVANAKEVTKHAYHNCGVCNEKNDIQPATKYCEQCEELLCKSCSEFHERQKITRTHKLVNAKEAPSHGFHNANKAPKHASHNCCVCKENNEIQPAIKFCEHCEEFLCKSCSEFHGRQKITRKHMLVDANASAKDASRHCNNCIENNDKQPAIKYCETCEEFLCKSCSEFHERQKITRTHKLVDAARAAPRDASRNCDVCNENNEIKPAIKYCETCEEFLCKSCSEFHERQKITRTHKLVDAARAAPRDASRHCDICNENNEIKPAIKYCETCEEVLCKSCSEFHERQKITRTHKLVDAARAAPRDASRHCDVCNENHEIKPAIKYCGKCEEFLCKSCSEYHERQKITRTHKLVDAARAAPRDASRHCDVCNENNEIQPAIKYCETCEEVLCKSCSEFHERQKITRTHKLVDAAKAVTRVVSRNCDVCNENNNTQTAMKYCEQCEDFLCKSCSEFHQRQKISRTHQLVETARAAPEDVSRQCGICIENNEIQPARNYCEQCEEFLCKLCSAFHHRQKITKSHKFVDAKTVPMTVNTDHENSDDIASLCNKAEGEPLEVGPEKLPKDRVESTHERKELTNKNEPSKPRALKITADSLDLYWEAVASSSLLSHYQIRYKDVDTDSRWNFLHAEYATAPAEILNLKANTRYIFQVRAVYGDEEGPYSQASDEIFTLQSPAARLVEHSVRVREGEPAVYALPLTEFRPARNREAKTRKFDVGPKPLHNIQEKTIMLVGATGTGKSTLVDGIVNYVLGVKWNDPFRFTTEHLEEEEAKRKGNQALSQTEWITCYTINPEQGSRLDYKLTIIDTPGFGDTRGLTRDNETIGQIRQLFSAPDKKGVVVIDAVCFLIKAPDARLTTTQTYIFNAILSLYGNDIEENIRTLVTFADGKDPPVLASLKESNLPFGKHFTFNNSGLFASNTSVDTFSLAPMFWDMGVKSFREFFLDLGRMQSVSLTLTKEVLAEREKLELTIQNLQPQVDAGLAKLAALKREHQLIAQHEVDIKSNKDFNYEVDEVKQVMKELPSGIHTTNCLICNYTCHPNCGYADDRDGWMGLEIANSVPNAVDGMNIKIHGIYLNM